MIRKTLFAVSTDETRYVLNGVFFQQEGSKCRMVSTDGHRLAYIQKKLEGKSDEKSSMIIPTKALNEVAKILSEVSKVKENEDLAVEITATENQVKFVISGVEIISRLIEGQFPNYEQVIPKETGKKIEVPTGALAAATRRVSILASEKSNSIKYKFSKGKTTISANTPDMGEAKEDLDLGYDGEELAIAFNAKYVLDVLKNVGTADTVVELTQPLNPGLFRPKDDADYLCVIMPMRV
jgi:DNA polymerase-3 subunit beta